MTVDDIFDELIKLNQFMPKESIKILESELSDAVDRGDVCCRDGHYMLAQIIEEVIGFDKSIWITIKAQHPLISEFVKPDKTWVGRGGSAPNVISFFGVFCLASILQFKRDRRSAKLATQSPLLYIFQDVGNKAIKTGCTVDFSGIRKKAHIFNPNLKLVGLFKVSDSKADRKLNRLLHGYSALGAIGWYSDLPAVREILCKFLVEDNIISEEDKAGLCLKFDA